MAHRGITIITVSWPLIGLASTYMRRACHRGKSRQLRALNKCPFRKMRGLRPGSRLFPFHQRSSRIHRSSNSIRTTICRFVEARRRQRRGGRYKRAIYVVINPHHVVGAKYREQDKDKLVKNGMSRMCQGRDVQSLILDIDLQSKCRDHIRRL